MAISSSISSSNVSVVDHAYERGSTEVSLADFVNAKRKGARYHDDYVLIDVDPEAHVIRCYRSTGEPGDRECVKVVFEGARIRLRPTDDREPDHFNLHAMQADTFLTWVDCLKWERSDVRVTLDWYQECGRPMMDDHAVSSEMLSFTYRTESGKERSVTIEKPWVDGPYPGLMAGY